ncbi:hypothetical protein BGZ51_003290 [Haplosporangium sp. Z 767]|nr:hypothetical protein BGZ51_003290 [Haplosporangium sp. Z 767]
MHPDVFVTSASATSGSSLALTTSPTSSSSSAGLGTNVTTTSKSNKKPLTTAAASPSTRHRPPFKSSSSAPLNKASGYKELVAQFTAKAPQPYGVIPPRRRKVAGHVRSSSTTALSITTSVPKKTLSSPPSPIDICANSVELQPTSLSNSPCLQSLGEAANGITSITDADNSNISSNRIIQPLFHSLQSLLPESTASSTRLGFWANLKAHYLAATATSLFWPGTSTNGRGSTNTSTAGSEEFSPPIALRLSNSTPVAAIDATTPLSASLTLTDAFLSLPNLATSSAHGYHGTVNYPVSVAAMDKFKPIRSDTIPLKTFTYHETPVVERPRTAAPRPSSLKLSATKRDTANMPKDISSLSLSSSSPESKTAKSTNQGNSDASSLPPLPRHLATRETRSNTDYLRMMAAELRMIRSRKLVSPLKPRGYLPRRKDPFRNVKSSLCVCVKMPREEDDHPLNDIMVGSWSSVSSTDSFLSTSSAGYQTANEGYF